MVFKKGHKINVGKKINLETRLKLSQKALEQWNNSEKRERIILAIKNSRTGELRKKLSEQKLGNKNPMKNQEVIEKMRQTKLKLYAEGKIKPWNKGLTKETDERVKVISEKQQGKKLSKEYKKKLSETHKGQIPWNKGLTKETDERVKKYGEKQKGKIISQDSIQKMKEAKIGKYSLNKHPNWLGGKSFEPYCPKFNQEFKNIIRLRDNFCCINCGISEQKYIILFNQKLHIHHIDYDKKNTCLTNCIALCNKCNTLANKNRSEWQEYYQDKLSKLYNYQYDKGEIIINLTEKEIKNEK